MLGKLAKISKSPFRLLKSQYKKLKFNKSGNIGENCFFSCESNVLNTTGNKDSLQIGKKSNISARIHVHGNGMITIGEFAFIGGNSLIMGIDSITIGSHVIISNNVHIYDNNSHPISPSYRMAMSERGGVDDEWQFTAHKAVVIEDNVWIGERSTILKGVHIGKGSIIGCDSVVTKNIPAYSIAVGNPAIVVKVIVEE